MVLEKVCLLFNIFNIISGLREKVLAYVLCIRDKWGKCRYFLLIFITTHMKSIWNYVFPGSTHSISYSCCL